MLPGLREILKVLWEIGFFMKAQWSWLTTIWHYPFTKKHSNKYLPKLCLLAHVFSRIPEHCAFSCKMEEKAIT